MGKYNVIQQPHFPLSKELARKALHVAFLYPIFFLTQDTTRILQLSLIVLGIAYYIIEQLRLRGTHIPLFSPLSRYVYRPHEKKKFTYAPLTLMIGIALTIQVFDTPVAILAIITVVVGDTMAAIIGKLYPLLPLPWNKAKSLGGLLGCAVTVFFVSVLYTRPLIAGFVALCTCLTESLNLEDLDNLVIPLSTGAFLYLVFY